MKTVTLRQKNRIMELDRVKQSVPHRLVRRPIVRPRIENEGNDRKLKGLQHILVPTDFSDESLRAVDFAARLAEQTEGTLTLLHVVQPLPGWQEVTLAVDPKEIARQCDERLQALAGKRGIDPRLIGRVIVRIGVPWDEITKAAQALKRDLIVIATHGYKGVKHMLLGSTAERVVRHAPCPVLVVH